jgi:hypothetical protein
LKIREISLLVAIPPDKTVNGIFSLSGKSFGIKKLLGMTNKQKNVDETKFVNCENVET